MKVEYVDHMGSDRRIAQAARVSTLGLDNDREKVDGLVRRLVLDNHTSPLESCVLTVSVDAPIFVAREWMRHRTQSYSEKSLRYSEAELKFANPAYDPNRPLVQVGKPMDYVMEEGSRDQQNYVNAALESVYDHASNAYEFLLREGISREVARNVLPVGVYTQFWATANLNNWFRFLELRLDSHAQYEIRYLAGQVAEIVQEHWPVAYAAWKEKSDG